MPLATVLVIPLISSALAFIGGQNYQRATSRLAQLCLLIVFLLALLSPLLLTGTVHWRYSFSQYQGINLAIDLQYDPLTWIMLCLVSFISLIIHSYSARYLSADHNQGRFTGQLSLLTFAVMLLIMSGSLLTAFIAWQLIGLSLYLLLNHYHYNVKANKAAKKKFMINRVGDICFLFAVIIMLHDYGTSEFSAIASANAELNPLILLLVFIAIMTKSAQFPFHIWLIDTMETPTPVSALMHAGVINSGGFLLARLSPWYSTEPSLLGLIFVIGLVTALLGQFFMLNQSDVKKQLAYSTMGQMGYMVMQCGLNSFGSAVFHLIAHGFFKSTLFLRSASTLAQQNNLSNNANNRDGYLIPVLVTLVFIVLGYGLLNYLNPQAGLNPLLWLFIAISLVNLLQSGLRQAKGLWSALLIILAIALFYLGYLFLFSQLAVLLHSSVIEQGGFQLTTFIGLALLALLLLIFLCIRFSNKAFRDQCLKKLYIVNLYKADIETHYRKYLINPTRRLGDILLTGYYSFPPLVRRLALVLIIAGLFFFSYESMLALDHNELAASPFLIPFATALLIINALMANRARGLSKILVILLSSSLILGNIAFYTSSRETAAVGIYHMINSLLILLAFAILLVKRTRKPPSVSTAISKNRLPFCHFYLSTFLLLFIGIPGTSSFITEFYLLSHLLEVHFIYALLISGFILLIALFVLHTLQVYFFNFKLITRNIVPVSPTMHIFFVAVILFNIYNGLYPATLLNFIFSNLGH
jgi:NADH:ubiquinone oxidoreductase subunit 5 (subunit L)/multisubunit Na+/H+ antiporter MnhA subunit